MTDNLMLDMECFFYVRRNRLKSSLSRFQIEKSTITRHLDERLHVDTCKDTIPSSIIPPFSKNTLSVHPWEARGPNTSFCMLSPLSSPLAVAQFRFAIHLPRASRSLQRLSPSQNGQEGEKKKEQGFLVLPHFFSSPFSTRLFTFRGE